jgi:uncharacterized protein involved in outer membrane biogenesis
MRRLRWVAVSAAVVALLTVGAVAFVATLDLNAYKGDVQAAMEGATGRKVEIAGPLALEWTPGPRLAASGVTVANADWGTEPAMATVGELTVKVALLPLIGGRVEIRRLALSDVRVLLERDAEGAGNWAIGNRALGAPSAGSGGAGPATGIAHADLNNVTVVWKPGPKAPGKTYRIDRLSLEPAEGGGLAVAGKAELDGEKLELTGTLPSPADLTRAGADLPVDVKGTFGGRAFAAAASLGVEPGAGGAPGRVVAEQLKLSFGELSAAGRVSGDLGGKRPRIDGELQAGVVDLGVLGGGKDAGGGGSAADPLDTPLPFDLLTVVDGKLDLKVDRLIAGGLAVDGLAATATLAGGVLTVDAVSGTVAQGPLSGRLELDGRKAPARLVVAGTTDGMDMGTVYRALMDEALVEGRGDALLDLRGTGSTPRALLASSQGVARLIVHEGVILNRYWELIAEDVATRFLPFVKEEDRGRLNCLVGRFDIQEGIADAAVLMVDSERVTVAGEGTVDLAAQTVDMRLVPRPKDPSLFSLATPILLTGPLADPRPAPDPVAVAKGLGSMFVGTALGPVGLLLPFLSTGSADKPCPEAIAAAEGRLGKTSGKRSREQDKPGGIKGLFDDIRKAIE